MRTILCGDEMAKIAISLPSDVLAFIDQHADGNRSAYLTRLVREEQIRRYVQGYIEQPDTGEEYSPELTAEALSLDPYDDEPSQ
jgi:metal-responsive CopG/Arc/MetJ family transcriptional regulator